MTIGPLSSLPGSVAGQSLAQTKGADVERASQETADQQRKVSAGRKAESAAGVGTTETDGQQAHDRDADGRLFWERRPLPEEEADPTTPETPSPADPSGTSGTGLDITA